MGLEVHWIDPILLKRTTTYSLDKILIPELGEEDKHEGIIQLIQDAACPPFRWRLTPAQRTTLYEILKVCETIHRRCFYMGRRDPSKQVGRCKFQFFVSDFPKGAIWDFAICQVLYR